MQSDPNAIDHGLTTEEAAALDFILGHLIPATSDGRLPSASEVGFFSYMNAEGMTDWVREGLRGILEEFTALNQCTFSELDTLQKAALVDKLLRTKFQFFSRLGHRIIECYYQNDKVLEAIGCATRPPFPDGFTVHESDLTILEPVYLRGEIYRKVEPLLKSVGVD